MGIIHTSQRVLMRMGFCGVLCLHGIAAGQVMLGPLPPLGSAPADRPPAATNPGEPSRWTEEDITPEQQRATALKEARAAYQVDLDICKIIHPSERADCIAQAKSAFEQQMTEINARFGAGR